MRLLTALLFAIAALATTRSPAQATCGTMPYTFVNNPNGSVVDANTTNANNQFLLSCASSVDNTQIGPNGIFASQVIPTSVATATFGGNMTYTFPTSIGLGLDSNGNGLVFGSTQFGSNSTKIVQTIPAQNLFVYDRTTAAYRLAMDSTGDLGISGSLNANQALLQRDSNGNWLFLTVPSGFVQLGANTAQSVAGVGAGTFYLFDSRSSNYDLAIDTSGNLGVRANFNASGAVTAAGLSTSTNAINTSSGTHSYPYDVASGNSTLSHWERFSVVLNASGAAVQTFATTFSAQPTCTTSYTAGSAVLPATVPALTESVNTTQIGVWGSASATVAVLCLGS